MQTQLDMANRMRQSSNPKLQEAGIAMIGKITDQQRAYEEQQETQRIARETQEATARREMGDTAWSRLQSVSDDLRTESAPFLGQKEAWGRIKASMADPSEAGDYALLYSVHKMLDPQSTVLASEFQNSQNLAGVPEIIVTARNQLREGQRLTPERRAAFVKMGETQYRQSSEQQAERNQRYLGRARAGGVPEQYLDTLQIPVFSPGEIPTDFGAVEPLPPPLPGTPEARYIPPTLGRNIGESIREGSKETLGGIRDFVGGLIGTERETERRNYGNVSGVIRRPTND
jgi:hypothetical protein